MTYLQVTLTSVLSIAVLFAITRLLGYRQLSELSLFDYINGITIGSIAAELATAEKDEIGTILLAVVIYGIVTFIISSLTNKSIIVRRFVTGSPYVLIDKGKLCYNNFKKSHLDMNEFLMKCRNSGYFDLSQIHTAIIEPNGAVSFIPMAAYKPVTANDINAVPQQDSILANVIIDGKIVNKSLHAIGKDEKWLITKLRSLGIDDISSVFLATCDKNKTIAVYEKSHETSGDILQ